MIIVLFCSYLFISVLIPSYLPISIIILFTGVMYSSHESGDQMLPQASNIIKNQPIDLLLSPEQFMCIQHHLPKGFVLIEKKPGKRDKKQPRINDNETSRLSGGIDIGDEKDVKKRERKKKNKYQDDMPRTIKRQSVPQTNLMLDDQLLLCFDILSQLKKNPNSQLFLQPVDPATSGAPDYYDVILNPMDLSTVQRKLKQGLYANADQFHADITTIWNNSYKYNDRSSPVYKLTVDMERFYKKLLPTDKKRSQKADKMKSKSGGEIRTQSKPDISQLSARLSTLNQQYVAKAFAILDIKRTSTQSLDLSTFQIPKLLQLDQYMKRIQMMSNPSETYEKQKIVEQQSEQNQQYDQNSFG